MDLDWEKLGAVDILAVLRSFLPAGGAIRSVTVYPSDYGLQRMKEEAAAGPQVRRGRAVGLCSRGRCALAGLRGCDCGGRPCDYRSLPSCRIGGKTPQ